MKFSPKIEEILARLKNIHARKLSDGGFEIYNKITGEVLESVSSEDIESATRRLSFRKRQKKKG